MNLIKNITRSLSTLTLLTIAFTIALMANYAYGQWTNPGGTPPSANAPAPVNVSSALQIKTGALTTHGFVNWGEVYVRGSARRLVIGASPIADEKLTVMGHAYVNLQVRANRYCDRDGLNCIIPYEDKLPDCAVGQVIEQSSLGTWICADDDTGTSGTTLPNCSVGQVVRYDGSKWVCRTEKYEAKAQTCATGKILKDNGDGWKCADDNVGTILPSCSVGQVVRYDGSKWVCRDTKLDALSDKCSTGQVMKKTSTGWACRNDTDTTIADTNTQLTDSQVKNGLNRAMGCSSGQVLKRGSSNWYCGTDNSGSGGVSNCSIETSTAYGGNNGKPVTCNASGAIPYTWNYQNSDGSAGHTTKCMRVVCS